MKKSKLTFAYSNTSQGNAIGFQLLFLCLTDMLKNTSGAFSKMVKSFTIDLPIAYANIRV